MPRHLRVFILLLWSLAAFSESRMDTIYMPTLSAKNDRPLLVYLPDGYPSNQAYPVLFLLHGINGDEYSWSRDGKVQATLDSLIKHQVIRPCIVVMPNTNSGKYVWGKRYKQYKDADKDRNVKMRSTMVNLLGYFKNRRGNFVSYFDEIETLIYERYSVSDSPMDRAVAGLSNGSMQAAIIANMHPGRFAWVGLFSPVIFDKQVPTRGEDWCRIDSLPQGTQFYVSVGNADIFRSYGISYSKKLKKNHIPYILIKEQGSHNWKVWRSDFVTFICYAFPYSSPTP